MKHQEFSLSTRYDACFAQLDANNQAAFVPFVTIGDPNFDLSLQIIETLIANGADALELGLPFSDPVADGPTIQGANLRALQASITPRDCFQLLATLRARHQDLPIGLLVYANLVYAHGIDDFYAKCQAAGVDSVLIADVPSKEAQPFRQAAHRHGIHHIMIIPPNANPTTLSTLASLGSGYSYLLSRAGVTGTETQAGKPIHAIIEQLNTLNAARPLLGFGIATPSDVSQAISAGANGAICGSAIVKLIEQYQYQPATLLDKLANFVHAMKRATLRV